MKRMELGHGRVRRHAGVPGRRQAVHRAVDLVCFLRRWLGVAAGSTRSGWVRRGPSVAAGGALPATRRTVFSPRPSVPASPAVGKPAVAATRPPSARVAAGVGVSQAALPSALPSFRLEPSKSLRRHLVPPGRVPPCPAASVGASIMSRRSPAGASPPPPFSLQRRPRRWEGDQGGALASPFNGGATCLGRPTASTNVLAFLQGKSWHSCVL